MAATDTCEVCGKVHKSGWAERTEAACQRLLARARVLPAAGTFAPEFDQILCGMATWGARFPPCVWDELGVGASVWQPATEKPPSTTLRHWSSACPLLEVLNDCSPLLRAAAAAVRGGILREGVPGMDAARPERFLVVDLCSGRPALLAMLLSELLPPARVSAIVACDRGWPYGGGASAEAGRAPLTRAKWPVPIVPRRADVRNGSHLRDLHKRVVSPSPGPALALAAHACGTTALRAVQFFNANPRVALLALKPCCFPGQSGDTGGAGAGREQARRKAVYALGRHEFSTQQVLDGDLGGGEGEGEGEAALREKESGGENGSNEVDNRGTRAVEEEGAAATLALRQHRSWAAHLLLGCDCGGDGGDGDDGAADGGVGGVRARHFGARRSLIDVPAGGPAAAGGSADASAAAAVSEGAGEAKAADAAAFCTCIVAQRASNDQRLLLAQRPWAEDEARAVGTATGSAGAGAGAGGACAGNSAARGGGSGAGAGETPAAAPLCQSSPPAPPPPAASPSPYMPPVMFSRAQLLHIVRRAEAYVACRFLSEGLLVAAGAAAGACTASDTPAASPPIPPRQSLVAKQRTGTSDRARCYFAASSSAGFRLAPGAAGAAGGGVAAGVAIALVRSTPQRFVEGGYAAEHYLREPPPPHDLCYELAELVADGNGDGGGNGDGDGGGDGDGSGDGGCDGVAAPRRAAPGRRFGRRFAYISFGPSKFGVRSDRATAERLRGAPRSAFPFLVPGRHFDMVAINRLGVLPGWRGRGAKELLLGLADAFHADGFPVRIKTASKAACASFSRCGALAFDCWQGRPSKSRGRVGQGGWVFWYTGSNVTHSVTGTAYRFVPPAGGPDLDPGAAGTAACGAGGTQERDRRPSCRGVWQNLAAMAPAGAPAQQVPAE
eukprot:g7153.t1